MIKFESFDEYVDITRQAQVAKMKNLNCYLLPDEINLLIEQGNLFYIINETTLQIIAKHGRYFKVYFYGTENFSFVEFFSSSLPIITDITYSFNLREKDVGLKEKLISMNFEINSSSSRMMSNKFDFDIKNGNYPIEKMKKNEVQEVLNIWDENFDPIENLLYDRGESLSKDSIYVLKNTDGLVIGVMEIVLTSKSGMIQHIAIKKDYQHRGLGSYLEIFYINLCKSLGIKTLLLYTRDDDLNAQRFHKKFGFDFDGKHNIQLIYRR